MGIALLSVGAALGLTGALVQVRRVLGWATRLAAPWQAALMAVGVAVAAIETILDTGSRALALIALVPLALAASFEGGVSWARTDAAGGRRSP